jgi:F-type H+-transporting ATPase subunit epsilon
MVLPKNITLEIVTPDRAVAHAEVDEVELPGKEGYFGVLPGHAPFLAMLDVGLMWYRRGQEKTFLAVGFGFAEVLPDRVIVLARVAENAEEIDVARAEAAKRRAEELLSKPAPDLDWERARVAMMKAMVRLQAASRTRPRR